MTRCSPSSRNRCPAGVLRRDRRGTAVAVVVLLVLAVTGLGLLTIRQGQDSVVHGIVSTDSQRALAVADACAAGAVKTLPMLLEVYLMMMRDPTFTETPPIVPDQWGADFFGSTPYGDTPRAASCVVQLIDIADDAPAAGYTEGGGCFKRITLLATATLSRENPGDVASLDVTQNQSATVREVIVRGLFGPVSCN